MKPISALALFAVAASMAAPGASAQGLSLKATIPFGFTIGDTYMPAGDYRISSPLAGTVNVYSSDGQHAGVTALKNFQTVSRGQNTLIFDRVGERYFLRRVLCSAAPEMNLQIPLWKSERQERTREAKLERTEEVQIAANPTH